MGASASELMDTITPLSFMPATCWMAPLMPTATYSSGATTLPVCPTCRSLAAYPASTAAREAPTAPPSRSAIRSTAAKFSLLFSARPPATTTLACPSSGRADAAVASPAHSDPPPAARAAHSSPSDTASMGAAASREAVAAGKAVGRAVSSRAPSPKHCTVASALPA